MRRKNDNWVNATHILKVANFDKAQRTKILEKEIQNGVHEKIQGGYGKYQGTWVPLQVARDLATQYHVDDILLPLFDFRESPTTPPPPVKRVSHSKAKSAAASQSHSAALTLKNGNIRTSASMTSASLASPAGFLKKQSTKKATKLATFPTESKPKPPIKRGRGRPSNVAKAVAAAAQTPAASPAKKRKLNDSPTPHKQFDDSMNLSGDSASVSSRSSSPSDSLSDLDVPEHPTPRRLGVRTVITDTPTFKKRKTSAHPSSSGTVSLDLALNSSSYEDNNIKSSNNSLICDNELVAAQYGSKLLDYFMSQEDDEIPDYLIHPPEGFNINHIIDDEGHTAFHWACSMGNLKIIVALLNAGANIHAVNLLKQTPLMRAVMFTNSYDLRSFSKIVDLLKESIFDRDIQQRTALHHITDSTAPRSKLSSTRYYTEIFLSKLSELEPMNVIEQYVNGQDVQGDTALHIAARNEARKCVKVLQSYHASPTILNKTGHTAQGYLAENEAAHSVATPVAAPPEAPAISFSGYPQYQYAGSGDKGKQNLSPTRAFTHAYSLDPASTPAGPSGVNGGGSGGGGFLTPASRPPYDTSHLYDRTGGDKPTEHTSETGAGILTKYLPLVAEKLEHLASIYDSQILDRKNDYEQVRQLVSNVKEDVKTSSMQLRQQIEEHGDETEARANGKQAAGLVTQRIAELRKVVDRSQARDLAQLVKAEEAKALPEYQQELERRNSSEQQQQRRMGATRTDSTATIEDGDDPNRPTASAMLTTTTTTTTADRDTTTSTITTMKVMGLTEDGEVGALALELFDLQRRRREHVTEILDLWSTAGVGKKMYQYRRLVAMACGVKVDEIDGLLGEIEQVLSEVPK